MKRRSGCRVSNGNRRQACVRGGVSVEAAEKSRMKVVTKARKENVRGRKENEGRLHDL